MRGRSARDTPGCSQINGRLGQSTKQRYTLPLLTDFMQRLLPLPFGEQVRLLKSDPELRRAVALEGFGGPGQILAARVPRWIRDAFANWGRVYPFGSDVNYEPDDTASVGSVAQREGRDPREVALDYMLSRDGLGFLLSPFAGYAHGNLNAAYEMLRDPSTLIGLSDGGAHCGVIVDAGMPTFMLTHWVRDRSRGPRLPLEFAVRKQTFETAKAFGMTDRGLLRPGYRADVNLIDFDNLGLDEPTMVFDLPCGAMRLMAGAHGYRATLVGGEIIQEDGIETGVRPGSLVRNRASN
jgi:N-acyl-D-amino-acid deacylase